MLLAMRILNVPNKDWCALSLCHGDIYLHQVLLILTESSLLYLFSVSVVIRCVAECGPTSCAQEGFLQPPGVPEGRPDGVTAKEMKHVSEMPHTLICFCY